MNARDESRLFGIDMIKYLVYANAASLVLMVFLRFMDNGFPLFAWHLPLFVSGLAAALLAGFPAFAAIRFADEALQAADLDTTRRLIRQSNYAMYFSIVMAALSLALFAFGWIMIGQPFTE